MALVESIRKTMNDRFGRLVSALAIALAMTAAPASASADINSFNAAVQSGDYRAAVAVANETWPTIDRASPDAAAIAREFGWIAMLADQPASALIYARFLLEQGPRLSHPDGSPAVSRVLFDWASLASAPSAQARATLLGSLKQRANAPGRDLISARAAHSLYADAWAASDWAMTTEAAGLAIRFLDEAGAGASPARFELRRGYAVSAFMRGKSADAYNAVYDIAAELYAEIAKTPPGAMRDRLASEYFSATAWGDALYSALGSKQKSTPDRRDAVTAGKKSISELLYPAPGDPALPRCRITLARNFRDPGFPFESRFKDFGGEVIYALDIDPGGTFTSPQLLATAPHDGFAEAVAGVVTSWRWKIDGAQPPSCRMPETHILTSEFSLGR